MRHQKLKREIKKVLNYQHNHSDRIIALLALFHIISHQISLFALQTSCTASCLY